MATIQTGIELNDYFTVVLSSIMSSVNLTIQAMEGMQEVMNAGIDTSALESAREEIDRAAAAADRLGAALAGSASPAAGAGNGAPPMPGWQSYTGPEVFHTTGMERFEQEAASANAMLRRLQETQAEVARGAAGMEILPPQAAGDIQEVEVRIQALQEMLDQVQNSPLDMGAEEASARMERLRGALDQALGLQESLNQAMQGADLGQINEAYLQLSANISGMERMVRDSFSHIPPVEVPVSWNTDSLQVFTGTGMERFEQEAASANAMLNALNQTQARIAARAAQSRLFPPDMAADMVNMQNRLGEIQTRIQAIENNPLNMGTEEANAELEMLRAQLDLAVQAQEQMNRAVEEMDVQGANEAYLRLSQIVGNTERHIRDNVDEQGRLNWEIEQGTQKAAGLMRTIGAIAAAYVTVQTLTGALELSDTLASTAARLNMMNDGLQTTQELQNMIYLSAERSRGAYQVTADAVSKLGLMAGDAFSSSREIVAFMEQINKQFTIAGTEASGIDAAMLQLTQAMGSGVLRGEEYNSILEQAPNIIQTIADYLEVPKGQLKDMAAEGQITADIVKAAIFAAADETNAKFESMPMTFEQVWTSLENTALMALQPLLEKLNEVANSTAFQQLVSHASAALSGLASAAGPIIERIANSQALWDFTGGLIDALFLAGMAALNIVNLLVGAAELIAENWSWLSPIIYGVAAALAVYYGWQMLSAAATGTMSAAQAVLNAVMSANPIMIVVLAVIALIAVFYAAVEAINHFAGTSISATGVVCGVFMVAAAFIGNLFVTLINFVIDIFVVLWNFIAAFANFFGNVFNDPIGAIARLFFDLVDCVLGLLEALASAIDTLFGSNLAGAVSGWRDSLSGWVDETFGQGQEIMATLDASSLHLGRFEYGEAWDAGYAFGEGIDESIAKFDPSSLFGTGDVPSAEDYAGGWSPENLETMGGGIEDISEDTGAISDALDITQEDLKYLRDIAEQEAINRYTTAEIKIEQTNNNNISSDMDLDGVVAYLEEAMDEAAAYAAEGVHL